MKWTDISALQLWASRPASKDELPLLISRLIRATTTKITSLSIPKGKSIYRGGWDGVVVASEATEFVPFGVSLWEFGTTADFIGKANGDYKKRTEDPEGHNPADATFVFVTPYAWEKVDDWIEEKMKEGKWKDIKVFDGNKLIEWLALAPVQSYWLAKEIGTAPGDGVDAAEEYWEDWKTGPAYVLTPQLMTTGRDAESKKLHEALQGSASVISIQASSRDEAIAFAIATILQSDEEIKEDILARCVVVETESSFKVLSTNHDKLILIAKLENPSAIHRAVSKGHFVVLPVGADEQLSAGNSIVLPRLDRDGFTQELVNIGLTKERAQLLSKESGRNITVLKRIENFGVTKPVWSEPANVRDIIPALLLGKWDEGKEKDKQLLSLLAGEAYDTYIAKLARWKYAQDTPIYQIGSKWRISSLLDVWSHTGKYIISADLEKLKTAFLQAIQYTKPIFDLKPEERYMASLYGKENEYSGWSREGLTQSLILLGVYGDELKITTSHGCQTWVDGVVYTLLKDADDGLWRSLNDVMPLIAEASPSSFLSGIESGLDSETPVITAIFEEAANPVMSSSYHTGVLWALEGLAWMPDFLTRVSIILGKLAIIDPGGTLSNRPINSLIHIFLPWHPQTYATPKQRLQTLQRLATVVPDIAWKLYLKLLPNHRGVAFQSHSCRWRKFNNNELQPVTYPELYKSYSDTVALCLSIVGINTEKLAELLDNSDKLSQEDRNRIIAYVKDHADKIDDTEHKLWAELRKTLGHHRSFPDAQWALPETELSGYAELYAIFTPKSAVEANKWILQDQWPTFEDGKELDFNKRDTELRDRRIAAVKAIEGEVGLSGIADLAPQLLPYVAGDALGYLIDSEEKLYQAFTLLNSPEKNKVDTLYSLLHRIYFLKGFDWIQRLYQKLLSEAGNPEALAHIVIPLPQNKEVWDYIDSLDEAVQTLYWRSFNPWLGDVDGDYKAKGMRKLMEAHRFGTVVSQLSFHAKEIPTDLIAEVLTAAATTKSLDPVHADSYTITRIFEELDARADIDESVMSKLEMYYLPLLTAYGSPRPPKMVHKELSTNPKSFVEILKWVFLANTDEQREEEQQERADNPGLGEAGYHLLDSWETIPGSDDNIHIDYAFLKQWITDVRKLAEEAGRLEVADMEIAKILACYRGNGDGIWPSDEICEIIDTINTKSIKNNFHAGIFNKNGLTVRGVFDGGRIESDKAAHFKNLAEQHAAKWPVTSSILNSLAREYEVMAKSEDDHAAEIDLDY